MKLLAFLRDTLWVGYALYFRPGALEQRLRSTPLYFGSDFNPIQLLSIILNLGQPAAMRYLAQISLLCALATIPLMFLAPRAQYPPSLPVLGLSLLLIWLGGLGVAGINAALGVGVTSALAILLGNLPEPTHWLTVATSASMLGMLRIVVVPGTLIGLVTGFAVGRALGPLAHRMKLGDGWTFLLEAGVASIMAGVAASVVAGDAVIIVAAMVACGVTSFNVGIGIPFGITFGVAFGVALGIAYGVTVGLEASIASIVAFFVTGTVVGFVAGLAAGFFVSMVLVSVMTRLVVVIAIVVAEAGIAAIVATALTLLPSILPVPLVVVGALLGISLGSRRWEPGELGVLLFSIMLIILAFIGIVFLPTSPSKAVLWFMAGLAGLLRVPIYAIESAGSTLVYFSIRNLPASSGSNEGSNRFVSFWRLDELIPFPLPFLDRLLLHSLQQNRRTGLMLVEEASGTPSQAVMAQRALTRLAAAELADCVDEASISAAARNLVWLPEIPSPIVQDTLADFYTVSSMMDEKRSLTDREEQLAQLAEATAVLDRTIQKLAFVPRRERELFLPIAQQWRAALRRATTRLPNPYVAGDPLRGEHPGLFVGRQDVFRELLVHLRDRSQRPTLILLGQKRVGKSSLLYQLPHHFDEQTVPVRVDCQAPEMQENNAAFLFNLARAIQREAREFRQVEFPPPPTLAEMTATAFSQWLEVVEGQLGERVLLLCLDEFERIAEAINRGWLDERILDFLRNLIQHHPQVTVLLAGSHHPEEIGRPWSNYLISAVVLPISYLQPKDVEKLVTRPIPGFPLHYRLEAVQSIIELTRCQPLLVQLLCQQVVILLNERGEREAGVAEIEAAVPGALSQGGSLYFTYLAEYDAGEAGQSMLRELARRGPGAVLAENSLTHGQPARQEALRRLLARDLIERVDGGIRFEVELTRRWWAEYGQGE